MPTFPRQPKGMRELKSQLLYRVNLSPSVGASDFSVPVLSAEWVFTAFDAPHIPPPPSIALRRVQTLTDSRPAVTCLITRDVRMPGIVFASPLLWSMRAFQKAKNEISVENCGSFANAHFNIENYTVRQSGANTFLQGFPYCAVTPLLWIMEKATIKFCEGCMCKKSVYEFTEVCLAWQ